MLSGHTGGLQLPGGYFGPAGMELGPNGGWAMIRRGNAGNVMGVLLVLAGMVAAAPAVLAANRAAPLTWLSADYGAHSAGIHALGPDAIDRFMGECPPSSPGMINVRFKGDHSGFAAGQRVTFSVQGSAGSVQEAFTPSDWEGLPAFDGKIRLNAPFWQVLSGSRRVVLSTRGAPVATLANIDTNMVRSFLAKCTPAAAPQPPAQANNGGQNNDVGRALALGVLGAGAAILAERLAEQRGNTPPGAVQPPPPQRPSGPPRHARSPQRVWAAHGRGSEVTATDCSQDCEEDIGIIFMCQGRGQPAQVDVPWVALDSGRQGSQRPLTVTVDGRRFDYTATLGGPGLVGQVPSFAVAPGDPLIDALQSGSAARVRFSGVEADIGLRGSRAALDIFKAHCGWNNVAQSGPSPAPPPSQPADRPLWFASSHGSQNGRQVQTLTFGIPETDNTLFSASCGIGGRDPVVELHIDLGNHFSGQIVPITMATSSGTFAYNARAFRRAGRTPACAYRYRSAIRSGRPCATNAGRCSSVLSALSNGRPRRLAPSGRSARSSTHAGRQRPPARSCRRRLRRHGSRRPCSGRMAVAASRPSPATTGRSLRSPSPSPVRQRSPMWCLATAPSRRSSAYPRRSDASSPTGRRR